MNPETAVYVEGTMTAISAVQLLVFLYFLVLREVAESKADYSMKTLATPFNIYLFFMLLSAIVMHATMIPTYQSIIIKDMVLQEHAELIRSFGGAINEISYIRYSALRAFLVMEETYPRIVSWVKILTVASPSNLILTAISTSASMDTLFIIAKAKFLCLIIGGIFIIAMDLIFVVTFIKYTGQTHLVSDTPDERFLIIIRYGIASVVLSASGLLCGCLYAMTAVQYWESGALAQFNILGLCLFLMKVDLHKEKLRKEKERESRIYKVKNSATSTKSSSSEDRVSICTIDARKNMETSPLKGHLRSLDRAGAK